MPKLPYHGWMISGAVDYAALTARPDAALVASTRREALDGAFGRETADELRHEKSGAAIVVIIAGGVLFVIFGAVTIGQWASGESWSDASIGLGATAVIAVLAAAAYVLIRTVLQPRSWLRSVRLIAFARANGLEAQPKAHMRELPGVLARPGRQEQYKSIHNRVTWSQTGLSAEAATYSDAGGGRNPDTFEIRFLAVALPSAPPRSTFRCGRNLGVRGEESAAWVDALVGTGGRSRLMCAPADADRVTAFFTPELRGVLTDAQHPANAEVAGNHLLLYYGSRNALDPTLWRCMFAAVDALEPVAQQR